MKFLIVLAVAALTAIVVTFVLKEIDGPWSGDSSIRTAIVGAASGAVATVVARSTRRKD